MEKFRETAEAAAFIASGNRRKTSPEIMRAIAFFARDCAEAEAIWHGDAIGSACTLSDIWEHATSNGAKSIDLAWGEQSLEQRMADI